MESNRGNLPERPRAEPHRGRGHPGMALQDRLSRGFGRTHPLSLHDVISRGINSLGDQLALNLDNPDL